jgi:hypothetical protein
MFFRGYSSLSAISEHLISQIPGLYNEGVSRTSIGYHKAFEILAWSNFEADAMTLLLLKIILHLIE